MVLVWRCTGNHILIFKCTGWWPRYKFLNFTNKIEDDMLRLFLSNLFLKWYQTFIYQKSEILSDYSSKESMFSFLCWLDLCKLDRGRVIRKRKPQLRTSPHQIDHFRLIWKGPADWTWCPPWASDPGRYKKLGWTRCEEQASSQRSPVPCASGSTSNFPA